MPRAILALKSCIRPCQNGSGHSGTQVMQLAVSEWFEPFWHSSYATGRARMARTILALKSCNLHGCARMARAILPLKFGQWHYLRAKMARAILALPTKFECHNGLSHSGTQVMQLAVSEWLESFLYTQVMHNGLSHSGSVSCTLLVCMNGSSHSGIANNI